MLIGAVDALLVTLLVAPVIIHFSRRAIRSDLTAAGAHRDRERLEDELREHARFIERITETAPNILYIYDIVEQRNVYANSMITSVLGFTPEEVQRMGTNFLSDLMHPEDFEKAKKRFREFTDLKDGDVHTFSYRILDASGEWHWLQSRETVFHRTSDGKVRQILGTVQDVTEQKKIEDELLMYRHHLKQVIEKKTEELTETNRQLQHEIREREQAEEALRRSREMYRTIFETTGTATVIIEENTLIFMINSEFEKLCACTKEAVEGKMCWTAFVPGEVLETMQEYHRLRRINPFMAPKTYETKIKDLNGNVMHVLATASMLPDTKKSIVSFLDITDRKRSEKLLREAEHLAMLGEMAAGVAHEINNPNNFILMNSELLKDIADDTVRVLSEYSKDNGDFALGGIPFSEIPETLPRIIGAVTEGSRRIQQIVEHMKRLSKQDRMNLEEDVDVTRIAENTVQLLGGQIAKNTKRFTLELSRGLPAVRGNPTQLEQVLINLLLNALQSLDDQDRGVSLSTTGNMEKGCVIIQVTDEGSGISEGIADRVFEPFFTTKSGGTGLGLSLSRKIIEEHGGKISISPGLHNGTVVTLELPVSQGSKPTDVILETE